MQRKPLSPRARSLRKLAAVNLAIPLAAALLYGVVLPLLRRISPIPVVCYTEVLLGLYCPGCGGTRAVKALLRLDLGEAFRYHAGVPVGAVLLLAVDAVAVCAFLRGWEDPFADERLARWLRRALTVYFWGTMAYCLARDLLLLWGIDLVGDLLPRM